MAKAPIEIRSLARLHTEEAIETMLQIMRDPVVNAAARASCAQYLIDRGWGKAIQAVEVTTVKQSVIRAPQTSPSPSQWEQTHVPEQHRTH